MEDSNRSDNPDIHGLSLPSRRVFVRAGAAAATASVLTPLSAALSGSSWARAAGAVTAEPVPRGVAPAAADALAETPAARSLLGFAGVPASTADRVTVPDGYTAQALAPWGEPVGVPGDMPAFKPDASNSAAEQALQMGMHHDGIHFFPLGGTEGAHHGLLVMNHEYVDDGLLHTDGTKTWSAEKVRKAQAAHGISVIEVARSTDGRWQMVRPSPHARRLTARTPFVLAGPAAGHALLRTAADPAGRTVLGTLGNCASGKTPWGTYLSGEENFVEYFEGGPAPDAHQRRWGMRATSFSGWAAHDERFDAARHPNEFNRFGWIVEIDPMDPAAPAVKRTALGRAAHEGATVALARDGRAVVYSGEDARFEYLYKFVSRDRMRPAAPGRSLAEANRELLDHGTLHVARFDAEGRGRWLPLVFGQGPLTPANGFADQAEVLIKTRQASDLLGATKMDRPEWVAVDTARGEVYCALTNNSQRGESGRPAVDAANPRARNTMGHILRWKEDGDFHGDGFAWQHFVLAGDPANARADARGTVKGDAFGSPDGVWIDPRGVLWIETDASSASSGQGDYARLGNNMMLAADPSSGEVRRFLTGPVGCEITGATMTPDGRTMFVNIQHPGEAPGYRSDPDAPTRLSTWPDGDAGGRPRSATVVISRNNGGLIGT